MKSASFGFIPPNIVEAAREAPAGEAERIIAPFHAARRLKTKRSKNFNKKAGKK